MNSSKINWTFYKRVIRVFIPILVQNVVTNFVSLLDNVMVGQVGTEAMSGVAITNQLIFIFNLVIFGGLAGAGIYTAQFYGKGDNNGICQSTRMKIYIALGVTVIFALVAWIFGGDLLSMFLYEGNEGLDLAATYTYGLDYLHVMMIQLLPFALNQVYASTLREVQETKLPMVASMVAVGVNLVGNYILIFGKFGAPVMGVVGAAISTVISRFVELGILVVYAHLKKEKFPFFAELYKSFKISRAVVDCIVRKGTLLLINELLWSTAQTILTQCYSTRGIEVVSAISITSTISNLFMCGIFASGSVVNIMVGQQLGAGHLDEAVDTSKRITILSILMCIVVGAVLVLLARPLADFYNTTENVKATAASLLVVVACAMPFHSYTNNCFFTLRSGGKVLITFMFDAVSSWAGYVAVAFALSRFTDMPILPLYICVTSVELIKCVMGYFMVRSRIWVVNLVADDKMELNR